MIILGLGSNMGDRAAYLRRAVDALSAVLQNMHRSRVLESDAVLPPGASPDMDRPFLNMAVSGDSGLPPEELLACVKAIERDIGRIDRGRWTPREIDIDLLAVGDLVWRSPGLSIPHPELLNRDFALIPLGEVAPGWRYPLPGAHHRKCVEEIIAEKGYRLGGALRDTGMRLHV